MNAGDEENAQVLRALYAEFDYEEHILAELGLSQYVEVLNEEDQSYLLGIPGMLESIREGVDTLIDECSDEIGW